ncbi:MAG: LuxR family transcriptional regulator [Flavobacteriaceae bacterium]
MKIAVLNLFLLFVSVTIFSQNTDATFLELKSNLDNALGKYEKITSLLAIGEYEIEREFNKAEGYFLDAEKLIKSSTGNHLKELAFVYTKLGVVSRRKGDYSTAISFYLKAKDLYEQLKDTTNIGDVIHNMGLVYRYQGEDEKAVNNFKIAIKLNTQTKDTFGVAAAYNMIGVSYRRLKKIDSALLSYKKAKELFTKLKREEDVRGVNSNLATLYSTQDEYDKSLPIKIDNLEYYKKVGNKMSICVGYYNISRDYSKLKEHRKSLVYADSSLIVGLKEGFKERVSKAYLRKSKAFEALGNYKETYSNFRLYKKYSDSIFNKESVKRIQELELKHEFEKERKELEFLKSEEESKVDLYIFLFILALIVGSLVGYLLWRNYTARVRIVAEKLEKSKLKKELLDEKVKVSESELKLLVADNTMRLQFIKQFSDQLKKDSHSIESEDVKQYTKSLNFKLQQQITTENKLTSLQDKIEEVNIGFNTKLMDLYPGLTKTEREVCSLLRVNLSIKEISSIRNVSIDAVKAARYRIRKKLQVSSGIELEHFIQNL